MCELLCDSTWDLFACALLDICLVQAAHIGSGIGSSGSASSASSATRYLVMRCRTVEIPHLTLCCICRPTKCSYCSSTGHCLPHECRVGPRRPCPPMMIETRCFNVIIWGRITAVGHIGHKVIVLGIVAPPPPPTVWRENDRMKPIPSHSTRSAVAWMV